MRRWAFPFLVMAITAAALGVGWGLGRARRGAGDNAAAAPFRRGPLLYQIHCASCHGDEGHGDGSGAAHLHPPPRDFAERPWRHEPTVASIRRVTKDGIAQTAMPSFAAALSEAELDAVADFVAELAQRAPVRPMSTEGRLLRDAGFLNLGRCDTPPLQVADAAGKVITLADCKGKLTLLHFWGTGCIHCTEEMPALDALAEAHAGRLIVLHVCADDDDPVAAQKILDRRAPGATAHCEIAGLGLARFDAQLLPTTWLIDETGKAIARSSGARDWSSPRMKNLIQHFLSQ